MCQWQNIYYTIDDDLLTILYKYCFLFDVATASVSLLLLLLLVPTAAAVDVAGDVVCTKMSN